MREISCDVIRDILPLYASDVVSSDTKKLILEHLETCSECKHELELLQKDITIPIQKETQPLKQVKKKINMAKIKITILSILGTLLILGSAVWFLLLGGIPAKSDHIDLRMEMQDEDGNGAGLWLCHAKTNNGTGISTGYKVIQESTEDGEVYRVTIYEIPIPVIVHSSEVMLGFGSVLSEEPPSTYDVTVTFVFRDKEITYSMRELGFQNWPATEAVESGG